MGTPNFSVAALQSLYDAKHDICAVYTRPPAKKGRGMKEQLSCVHAHALELGLGVHYPTSLKTPKAQKVFVAHQADLAVVVAYGLILPLPILGAPRLGCWNIHASLLPRWRGAAPIHRAIMAGDKQTGISIMQMDAGLDTGPVLLTETVDINPIDTTSSLQDKLMAQGAKSIMRAIKENEKIEKQADLSSIAQPEEGVVYAEKIDKAETQINWSQSAMQIAHHIHGLSPFPGAWTLLNGQRLKILQVRISNEGGAIAGLVLDETPHIACGDGSLEILYLQKAGKSAMSAPDFQRGGALPVGAVLGEILE